jgi:hypothetical protein
MSSTAVYRASVIGAGRPGRRLIGARRALQAELTATMREEAGHMERIARPFAPKDRGLLRQRLEARVHSRGGRIFATLHSQARNPTTGFAYTNVTRFGHRKRWIYPRRASHLVFRGRDGNLVFAKRVRGYRPENDWAELAAKAMDAHLSATEDQIGRRILTRLF